GLRRRGRSGRSRGRDVSVPNAAGEGRLDDGGVRAEDACQGREVSDATPAEPRLRCRARRSRRLRSAEAAALQGQGRARGATTAGQGIQEGTRREGGVVRRLPLWRTAARLL